MVLKKIQKKIHFSKLFPLLVIALFYRWVKTKKCTFGLLGQTLFWCRNIKLSSLKEIILETGFRGVLVSCEKCGEYDAFDPGPDSSYFYVKKSHISPFPEGNSMCPTGSVLAQVSTQQLFHSVVRYMGNFLVLARIKNLSEWRCYFFCQRESAQPRFAPVTVNVLINKIKTFCCFRLTNKCFEVWML